VNVDEVASRVVVQVYHTGHTHGSRDKLSLRIESCLSHSDRFTPPHVPGAASPSPRFREPGARAMPPVTGVGERCAPRATWSCIDERNHSPVALALRVYPPSQGSGLAASLAPRPWHEQHGSTPTEPQTPRDA
jgi:hypothetical protein